VRSVIPYERYHWMAFSFRGFTIDNSKFLDLIYDLLRAEIPTTIVNGLNGPIIVTWQRPANA
jgi:hypothetical protein